MAKNFAGVIGYKESKFINSSESMVMEARNGKQSASSKSLGKHTRICSNQVSNVRNEHATKELHMRMIESGFKTARG